MVKRYRAVQIVDTTGVSRSGCLIAYPSGRITLMAVLPAKAQFPVWDETFGSLEELELRRAAEGIPWEDVDASSVSGGRWRELLP